MHRLLFLWHKLARRIWFRVGLYGLAGVGAALMAVVLGRFIPDALSERLGGPNVEGLLTILANSLLAVAIFGAGTMVTAYTAVSNNITPRAAGLVTTDNTLQGALSTFVGGFLYAIVALTALSSSYYGKDGRTIVYIITLGVVGLVAINILLIINRLTRLARVDFVIQRIEEETSKALEARAGWEQTTRTPPGDLGQPSGRVLSGRVACIQNIDVAALDSTAEAAGITVEVLALPGDLVGIGQPLLEIHGGEIDEACQQALRSAFSLGDGRSFDQDPRYGMIVLGEIAARALSPGVNDPGTAIAVIRAGVALLSEWDRVGREASASRPQAARVFAQPLSPTELLDDIFSPIARYGSGDLAVSLRLQKALKLVRVLSGPGFELAATNFSTDALARAKLVMAHAADMDRLAESAKTPDA
jgi:uncharacterized membrane protein